MKFYLTSYENAKRLKGHDILGVASYDPKWSKGLLKASVRDLAPKKRNLPVEEFAQAYRQQVKQVLWDVERMGLEDGDVLCCWCTMSQQRAKGKNYLMCHTILLAQHLVSLGHTALIDEERAKFCCSEYDLKTEQFDDKWWEVKS